MIKDRRNVCMPVEIARIYEEKKSHGNIRILVDGIWPRGISKEEAKLDYWLKDVAPSNDLRKWFNHDADKYEEFKERYKKELETGEQQDALEKLKKLTVKHQKNISLLYGAKDKEHNQAKVLKEIIDRQKV